MHRTTLSTSPIAETMITGMFLNTVGDTVLLEKVLDAADRFRAAPSDAQMEADLAAQGIQPLFTKDFSGP